MTIENTSTGVVRGYGFNPVVGFVQFLSNTSNGAQTLIHSFGVTSVTRTGTGAWTVVLSNSHLSYVVVPAGVYTDTNYHEVQVRTQTSTGFTATHRTVAYGSMGSVAADDNTGVTSLSFLIYAVRN